MKPEESKQQVRDILQPILFPQTDLVMESGLYYSVQKANEYIEDGCLQIEPGAVVDFNSYFNAFSSGKWNKYSDVKDVCLTLSLQGHAEVSLFYNYILYGQEVHKKLLTSQVVADEPTTYVFDFGALQATGSFSFDIKAIGECTLFSAAYVADGSNEKVVEPRLAIVFTTYNREAYITENVDRIGSLQDERIALYIVDNAGTLTMESGKSVRIIRNRNAGGAAGFARGMMQVIDDADACGYTHCILMDDDILLDPRILQRLMYFLEHVREEYRDAFVSGAMFRRDLPYFHVEAGAIWNQGEIRSVGQGLDMRSSWNCLRNEQEEKLEYAAWWFCVIPIDRVRADNLPIPLFVFNDDVDYGLRNKAKIITINGICVWHDAFESKVTAMRRYYESRNQLIVNSVNEIALAKETFLKQLKSRVKVDTYLYKYENVLAMLDGVEDFLKGPDWLCALKPEVFNAEVLQKNVKFRPIDPLSLDYDWYRLCCTITDCDRLHKWVRILTRNGLWLSADRKIILPFYAGNIEAGYRASQITYYDEITHTGFVAKRDKDKIKECFRRYKNVKRLVLKEYDRVVEEYAQKKAYLTSREQWEQYLGMHEKAN